MSNYDRSDIERLQKILYTWASVKGHWEVGKNHGGAFTMADITKSCLLAWLTLGNEPLEYPPPVMAAAPQHALIKKGWCQVSFRSFFKPDMGDQFHIEGWPWLIVENGETDSMFQRLSRCPRGTLKHYPDLQEYEPLSTESAQWFIVPNELWKFSRHQDSSLWNLMRLDDITQSII